MKKFLIVSLSALTLTAVAGCSVPDMNSPYGGSAPGVAVAAPRGSSEAAPASSTPNASVSTVSPRQEAAVEAARAYRDMNTAQGTSRVELFAMLTHHGWFTEAETNYAIGVLQVNFSAEAVKAAKYWVWLVPSTDREETRTHLTGRGFTTAQANYAISQLTWKTPAPVTATPSAPPVVTTGTPVQELPAPSSNSTFS